MQYMIKYDKNKESSYIQYLDASNLYGFTMSQKLPVDGLKWKKNISKCNEDFIKNYDEESVLPESMKVNKCSKLYES